MFNNLVESLESTMIDTPSEVDDNLDKELDSLLDDDEYKDDKIDLAEKEYPRDEGLLFSMSGNVKEFDTEKIVKESFEFEPNRFVNDKEDFDNMASSLGMIKFSPDKMITGDSLKDNIELSEALHEYDKFSEENINLNESFCIDIDGNFSSTGLLDEALTVYEFNREIAEANVSALLEKQNPKMKKRGYLPLTSVNNALKVAIAEVKNTKSFKSIKSIKLNGVVCLQYALNIGDYKKVGVCYFNKDTNKIRVFDVNGSVKVKNK